MTKKLKAFCLGMAFSLSTFVWAAPANVEDVINSKYLKELQEKGLVIKIHNGTDEDYSLVPQCELTQECNSNKIEKSRGNFAYTLEYLYLIPKKEIKETSKTDKESFTIEDCSVIMRSASKMVSAKYYSNTRKKVMNLYKKVYMIENEKSRKPIADPVEGSAEGKTYYVLQDDASFGETVYRQTIKSEGNSIYCNFNNLTTMGMGFIKAIKPENLGISIIVIDCGDDFVLYMCMDTNCKKFPGVESIMSDSLKARMVALKEWILTMF